MVDEELVQLNVAIVAPDLLNHIHLESGHLMTVIVVKDSEH